LEKELISFYGRRDKKEGTLVNMTDGGDGCPGYRHSSNFIEMIRSIERTESWKNKISASLIGKQHSTARKIKNSNSQIGLKTLLT